MFQVSRLTQKKIEKFKKNKRAYFSLKLFLIVFLTSLFAEFIANENPLLIRYKGEFFFPTFISYPETAFGGTFETQANYQDEVVVELIQKDGWLLRAPIPFSSNTINYDLKEPAPSAPDRINLLGTDDQGRDLCARLIYGFRLSILFGLTLTLGAVLIGISLGAIQGYFGGKTDLILQRLIEIWTGLPTLFLLIIR